MLDPINISCNPIDLLFASSSQHSTCELEVIESRTIVPISKLSACSLFDYLIRRHVCMTTEKKCKTNKACYDRTGSSVRGIDHTVSLMLIVGSRHGAEDAHRAPHHSSARITLLMIDPSGFHEA